jgi:hypothetical protein
VWRGIAGIALSTLSPSSVERRRRNGVLGLCPDRFGGEQKWERVGLSRRDAEEVLVAQKRKSPKLVESQGVARW